jgi:hypothetical protein
VKPSRLAIHPSDEMPVRIRHHVRPSTESANKTGTIASRSETRGHHLPATIHKCNGGYVPDLNWKGRGININGEYISHLRFADDIVIMAETLQDLQLILNDLADFSARIGLRVNLDKTKVMFNEHVLPEPIVICGAVLKVVQKYVYLGQTLQLGRNNFEA